MYHRVCLKNLTGAFLIQGHSVPYGEVDIWRSSGRCRAHEGAIGCVCIVW